MLRLLERYSITIDRTKSRSNGDILLDDKRAGVGYIFGASHQFSQGITLLGFSRKSYSCSSEEMR